MTRRAQDICSQEQKQKRIAFVLLDAVASRLFRRIDG